MRRKTKRQWAGTLIACLWMEDRDFGVDGASSRILVFVLFVLMWLPLVQCRIMNYWRGFATSLDRLHKRLPQASVCWQIESRNDATQAPALVENSCTALGMRRKESPRQLPLRDICLPTLFCAPN